MRIMYRYLALFLSLVFFTLPAEAGPGTLSEYGNFTGEPGWNTTQNTSYNYFYSDSGLVCVAAGDFEGYGEEIYADGIVEEITFITDSPESELFPVWTADGNHIVYTVQRDGLGNSEFYIMKEDGSEIERINIGDGNLTGFSDINPNGTELIFTKSIDSQPGLYLMNLENGTVSPVADDPDKSEGWGAWCRLGRKIVYTQRSGDSPSQLWIVDRNGSNKTRLGTSENVGVGKDWCPLGLKVLYSAKNSKENPDLWVIDWYGTNQTQLTDTPYGEWNPSFSPDGKRIVYISDESGKPEIWLRDIEGKYRIRLTNNIGITDSNPRWSPDGSKIVFTAQKVQGSSNNSTIDNSSMGNSSMSNSTMGNSTIESSITEGSTIENSIVENYTVGNSEMEILPMENSSIENYTVENPTLENSTMENYAVGDPKIENPIVSSPDSILLNKPDSPILANDSATTNDSTAGNSSIVGDNFVITNNSVTNGSNSGIGNGSNDSGSNNSMVSNSDIAVIKLGATPAVISLDVASAKIDSAPGISGSDEVNISTTVGNES